MTNRQDLVLDLHPTNVALGDSVAERQKAHEECVLSKVPEDEIQLIRELLQKQQLTGRVKFRVEAKKN